MLVENGPLGFPTVGLNTLAPGATFEMAGYAEGTEFVVCRTGYSEPTEAGKVAVFRLRDGAVMLLNIDSTVAARPLKVVPVG